MYFEMRGIKHYLATIACCFQWLREDAMEYLLLPSRIKR